MQRPSRSLWVSTLQHDGQDNDASDVPVLTPLWSGQSDQTTASPHTSTPQPLPVFHGSTRLPAFVDAAAMTEMPSAPAELPSTSSAAGMHNEFLMGRDESLLFDPFGRATRYARGTGAGNSQSGTPAESLIRSPLLHGDMGATGSAAHTRTNSLTFQRTPATGRTPARPAATLGTIGRSASMASLGGGVQGSTEASRLTRGLKLRTGSELGTPSRGPISPTSFHVDPNWAVRPREDEESSGTASLQHAHCPGASTTSECLSDTGLDPRSPMLDQSLSMGLRSREVEILRKLKADEVSRRRSALIREALFYLFITSCFCCFLFSWMMHRRHISFLIPAHHRHWVPSQKSSALFRSGLYYLILALICRVDAASAALYYLSRVAYEGGCRAMRRCRRAVGRAAWANCSRVAWTRVVSRWQRFCKRAVAWGGDNPRWSDPVSRHEATAKIMRVPKETHRSAAPRSHAERERAYPGRTPIGSDEESGLSQAMRRWRSLASAVRGLGAGVWHSLSNRFAPSTSSPAAAPPVAPRRRWAPRANDDSEGTFLL